MHPTKPLNSFQKVVRSLTMIVLYIPLVGIIAMVMVFFLDGFINHFIYSQDSFSPLSNRLDSIRLILLNFFMICLMLSIFGIVPVLLLEIINRITKKRYLNLPFSRIRNFFLFTLLFIIAFIILSVNEFLRVW